jgi:acetyltransferase
MMALSQRVAHERLTRICFIDYDREIALVAEVTDPDTNERVVLGVGRLSRLRGTREAEFSLLINDQYQRRRLGTELVRRLIHIGREEKLEKIRADIMAENVVMQRVCKKLGFRLHHESADGLVSAELDLSVQAAAWPP